MEGSFFITSLILASTLQVLCSAEETCTSTSDVGQPLILTEYIESGKLETARSLSKVTVLGWSGHSGFFTVNKNCGGNLFFWFIRAKNNWENAPVMLWLNGGPGGSSLIGLFNEIGPFTYSKECGLEHRKYTWNRNMNILYVDQPVGTGFSFPKNSCLVKNCTESTEQLYSLLVQFFTMCPELQKNRLYLAGQSYAGHYVPALGSYIHGMNQLSSVEVKMNLAGTLIGNAGTKLECHSYGDFMYDHGFIGANFRDDINKRHANFVNNIHKGKNKDALNNWLEIWGLIVDYTKLASFYSVGATLDYTGYFATWLETPEARCKLHVGNMTYVPSSDDVYNEMSWEMPVSFTPYVETLLDAEIYSVIFYSGNLDVSCLTTSTDCMLDGLDWWGAEEYRNANRTPWFHDGDLAGNFKHFGNLYFVIIKDTGHMVPMCKPAETYDLINCISFPSVDNLLSHLNTTPPY